MNLFMPYKTMAFQFSFSAARAVKQEDDASASLALAFLAWRPVRCVKLHSFEAERVSPQGAITVFLFSG